MGSLSGEVKDRIFKKLHKVFGHDMDTFTRVLYYLDKEAESYRGESDIPPFWRTLKNALVSDKLFKTYAERFAQDTKTAKENPRFLRYLSQIYSGQLEASEEEADVSDQQGLDVNRITNVDDKLGLMAFARSLALMPPGARSELLTFARSVVPNQALVRSLDDVVSLFNKAGGKMVTVGLAAVYLTYDMVVNIRRWWKGEISGVRCCKNIIDSSVGVVAGVGGGVAGMTWGAMLGGPVGAFIGGIVGGIAAGQSANLLSDRLTQWLFGLPKEESLENAYNYFSVKMSASNHEINTSYRRLCLQHHPDKGGSAQEFHLVQINMAVIKAAKGDL